MMSHDGFLQSATVAVGDWLLMANIRIAFLIVTAAIGMLFLRGLGAGSKAIAWRTVLIMCVIMAFLPHSFSSGISQPVLSISNTSSHGLPSVDSSAGTGIKQNLSTVASFIHPSENSLSELVLPWSVLAVLFWCLLVLILALRHAIAIWMLRLWLKRSCPADQQSMQRDLERAGLQIGFRGSVNLQISGWSGAPASCGWVRPVILLPESSRDWDSTRLKAILAHELVHCRYRDNWILGIGALLKIVFWFNPFVYLATRQVSRYQELRCDSEVVQSGVDSIGYASLLIDLARKTKPNLHGIALRFSSYSRLEERVASVISTSRQNSSPNKVLLFSSVLLATTACALGVQQIEPAPKSIEVVQHDDAEDITSARESVSLPARVDHIKIEASANIRILSTTDASRLTIRAKDEQHLRKYLAGLKVRSLDGMHTVEDRHGEASFDPGPICIDVYVHQPTSIECFLSLGEVECIAPVTSISVYSSRGSITLRQNEAVPGPISLRTSSGSIRAELPLEGSEIIAMTSLGDVDIQLSGVESHGYVSALTSKGDVTVRVPALARIAHDTARADPGSIISAAHEQLVVHTRSSLGSEQVISQ